MTKKQVRESFRNAVFSRAHYRCEKCGKNGLDRQAHKVKLETKHLSDDAYLDAHHITMRDQCPNGGYVASNGISLCSKCHMIAEQYNVPGFTPTDLYKIISSSFEQAMKDSEKL